MPGLGLGSLTLCFLSYTFLGAAFGEEREELVSIQVVGRLSLAPVLVPGVAQPDNSFLKDWCHFRKISIPKLHTAYPEP